MRAPNTPYKIETLKLPQPGKDEVLVKMAFAGICRSDENVWNGKRPHPMPCVTGHEGSGVVEAVGGGVSNVKPGDHVILNWQPACGECFHCLHGQSYLCPTYPERVTKNEARFFTSADEPVFSYSHLGCFSERVIVRKECCVPIGKNFPLDIAALIGCAITTGVGAVLNTARIKNGDGIAVFGVGGVGVCVLMAAKYVGAKTIIAVDKLASREKLSRDFGATHFLLSNSAAPAAIKKIADGLGVDFAFDAAGHPDAEELCFKSIRSGGTAVMVGLPRADSRFMVSGWELVGCEKKIAGSLYGSAKASEFFPLLADLHTSGKFDFGRLISKKYFLEEINEGFEALRNGENIRGIIEFG